MHRAPSSPTLAAAALLVAAAALTTGCADAQSASSRRGLPACEWCGTAEAPSALTWRASLAPESEPGEPLVVRGVVRQPDGDKPAPGVILYFYQTNARGVYPKRGDETGNARRHGYLRGWVRTDDRGRYEIRTIRPGNYPGGSAAAHIHVTVQEPDGRPEYYLDEFLFADDPYLRDRADEDHVLEPELGADGVWRAEQDILLRRNPAFTATAAAGDAPPAPVLCVDTRRSVVRWRGTKRIGGSQAGTVRLAHGQLHLRDGRIAAAQFVVDMTTIAVTSIPDRDRIARRTLERHLAHEEWFAVERFPTARLVVHDVAPGGGLAGDGGVDRGRGDPSATRTFTVAAQLAIRDSVHAVTFQAEATTLTPEEVRATAELVIDRQRWGVQFDGATSALRNLLVRDEIELGLELVARADACVAGSQPSGHATRPTHDRPALGPDLPTLEG